PGTASANQFDAGGRAPQAYAFTIPASCDDSSSSAAPVGRPVWRWAPVLWMVVSTAMLTLGLMLLIAIGTDSMRGNDVPPFLGIGVGALVASLFCFTRMFKRTYTGMWGYLIKPVLLLLCVESIVISAVVMGNLPHMQSEEAMT